MFLRVESFFADFLDSDLRRLAEAGVRIGKALALV